MTTQNEAVERGRRMRERREAAGVSLAEMAARLHFHRTTLWRFESGERVPRDLATVMRAYEQLEPKPAGDVQPKRHAWIRIGLWTFVGLKWTTLLFIAPLDVQAAAVVVRAYGIATAAVLAAFATFDARRARDNPAHRLHLTSAAVILVGLIVGFAQGIASRQILPVGVVVILAGMDMMIVAVALRAHPR